MPKIILGRATGKSAYEYAVEGGYTGTEEQFAIETASCPMHARNKNNPHAVTAAQTGAAEAGHSHVGGVISPAAIELTPGTGAGHGGYIDFHFNGSAADHTARIIESAAGQLNIVGIVMENGNRVYSPGNKPTPADIGTMTTAQINGAISAAITGAIEGSY